MNYPALIDLLEKIESYITPDTNIKGTIYANAEELADDVDAYISEFLENSGSWIPHLDIHFKKNGTFQQLLENNRWDLSFEAISEQYQAAKQ